MEKFVELSVPLKPVKHGMLYPPIMLFRDL